MLGALVDGVALAANVGVAVVVVGVVVVVVVVATVDDDVADAADVDEVAPLGRVVDLIVVDDDDDDDDDVDVDDTSPSALGKSLSTGALFLRGSTTCLKYWSEGIDYHIQTNKRKNKHTHVHAHTPWPARSHARRRASARRRCRSRKSGSHLRRRMRARTCRRVDQHRAAEQQHHLESPLACR